MVKLGHGNNPALGQAFLDLIDEAFDQHRYWRENQDASAYLNWAMGFKLRITQSIEQWIGRAGYEAGKLLRSLRDKAEPWWYFLDHPEIPQDFNQAERSLRLAVTKRKVSGGSRAMERFAQTADLRSCSANLSPTGAVGYQVFPASFDRGVRQWQVPTIPLASTQHLNPYPLSSCPQGQPTWFIQGCHN